jgi:F-type H+-transporting ATPase subunit b
LTTVNFVLSALMMAAPLMAAAGEEQVTFWNNQALWRVLNLIIFVLVLVYLFRNKIKIGDVFNNRAASIARELERARREKQDAQERLSKLEARLSNLDKEIQQIRDNAAQESLREADRIQKSADTDAEKIRQAAQQEIAGAMKAARNELRAFVAEQSVALAEGIIRREIKPDDNNRMLNKYIDDLGEVKQ